MGLLAVAEKCDMKELFGCVAEKPERERGFLIEMGEREEVFDRSLGLSKILEL